MNHASIKRLFVLVMLLTCAAVPSSGSDCDDPLNPGSSCQSQDLNSNGSGGADDDCGESPISVMSAAASGSTLVVGLANPSQSSETGFVVTEVLLGGRPYVYIFPVSLTSGALSSVAVSFPAPVSPIGVITCAMDPGGINEGPDVVGMREEQEAP